MTVTSNDPFPPTATYTIVAEVLSIAPAPRIQVFTDNTGEGQILIPHITGVLDLGTMEVDTLSTIFGIEIRNIGDADLVISAIHVPSIQGFSTNFEGPETLRPGDVFGGTLNTRLNPRQESLQSSLPSRAMTS